MSSSTSRAIGTRGRVVRDDRPLERAVALDRELSNLSVRSFDPERIETARREGHDEGFAQGHSDGFAIGLADGRAAGALEVEDDRRRLQGLLLSLRDQLAVVARKEQDVIEAAEATIVEGAFLLAEAVVGRELAVTANPGRDAIVRALQLLPPAGGAEATVRMHPDDVKVLGSLDDLALGTTLEVIPDASIEAGGCVLDAGDCRIDAQLRPALERVAVVLAGRGEDGVDVG